MRAAAEVGQAQATGAELGAQELLFRPAGIRAGHFDFEVGSAGSTTLVLQTVLPALLQADAPSSLILRGGTHNPQAPTFEFLERAFLPLLRRMGANADLILDRPGFYPAGGGRMRARVEPVRSWKRLELLEQGELRRITAHALVANLPRHVAERELQVTRLGLGLRPQDLSLAELDTATGPGNVLTLTIECANVAEVVSGFGRKGKPAETVASEACAEARAYLDSNAPVGVHLADQLLLPVALAGGRFRTQAPSSHARTNAEIINMFLPARVRISQHEGGGMVGAERD